MLNLLFPHLCCGCNRRLPDGNLVLCVNCRNQLAVCFPKNLNDNEFTNRFYGRLLLQSGYALLRMEPSNLCRSLIHGLKYKGKQNLGVFFARWMAALLQENQQQYHYDLILPVPLSRARLRKRGYNQVNSFATTLAAELSSTICKNGLVRRDNNQSTVSMSRGSRFGNPHEFAIGRSLVLKPGMHILVVDDTITTGATLEACAKVLLNAADVKLSFATIAMTA